MISDAFVYATCDRCYQEETVELTALARSGEYDMRSVKSRLEGYGWRVSPDLSSTICDSCSATDEEGVGE